MAIKKLFQRLSVPVSQLDQARLRDFCAALPGVTPITELVPREEAALVGEITTLRIVPRAGSPSLEATISDGTGTVAASWTGRRRIAGVTPGRRLVISGRGAPGGPGGRLIFYNPRYELL